MRPIGIEALDVHPGLLQIPASDVFAGRGLDAGRFGNLTMSRRSVALPFEDPVTNAVNAAAPLLDRLGPDIRDRVELLVTTSESGIDYSKSIASYVHRYLGLGRNCRLVEMKQACYSATAALQLALAQTASGFSEGAKALVVATDVSLADARAEYAEPATGTGAVAMLVGDEPRVLTVDQGAFGTYSFETLDSARPAPDLDIADVDRSLLAYLECLGGSFADYCSRVEDADFVRTFDHLAMHTPFAGMVKAGHRRMMRELGTAAGPEVEADFARRVAPSLVYPGEVGNLFSGSLYLALAALIDQVRPAAPARVGLFSYGSGCSSEFFSGVIGADSTAALAEARIAERIAGRGRLTFAEYDALLDQNRGCLHPDRHRRVDHEPHLALLDRVAERPKILALAAIEDYHRRYEWI
ncbi:hydroxymethylglutaryl-CoA synthase family protein [Kitasatospora sp. NPDC056138]|uniref:hydroxymethylglutaryl-CoA synthase family protein n=1 Tax=Kitasatospora sp. NPDC056138 TaxID=3345724 RepID=UPI0035DB8199